MQYEQAMCRHSVQYTAKGTRRLVLLFFVFFVKREWTFFSKTWIGINITRTFTISFFFLHGGSKNKILIGISVSDVKLLGIRDPKYKKI